MSIKYLNIKEFREKGYLQEANRRFFHPLGVALEVTQHRNRFLRFLFLITRAFKCLFVPNDEDLTGVWDSREDPVGFYYDYKNSDKDRILKAIEKNLFICNENGKRCQQREDLLGERIEPFVRHIKNS